MIFANRRCRSVAALPAVALALALPAAASAQAGPASDRYYVYQLNHISMKDAGDFLTTFEYTVTDVAETAIGKERPIVVKLPETATTSIVTPSKLSLGGTNPLPGPPTGVPLQRLLIVWDEEQPGDLRELLSLLHEKIDVPARQIRIEAMILELDRNRIKDLGVTFDGKKDGQVFSFGAGALAPFAYTFERPSNKTVLDLSVTISALVQDGSAEVLSQPSVLVLDGRQARIRVGDQIPYTEILSSDLDVQEQIVSDTQWADTGIALNLRPRATGDGSEVTMQVETLISEDTGSVEVGNSVLGPPIATREIQTIVRVGNNTPFIIGGLISRSESDSRSGIPVLSKIPGIGKLFRKTNKNRTRKEVIVVITPHVIPLDDSAFSFSVAEDTDLLDHFDLTLFRSVYRIKSDDVFDLAFVRDSKFYRRLRLRAEQFADSFARKATAGCVEDDGTVEAPWSPLPPGDKAALARQMRRAVADRPCFLRKEIIAKTPGLEKLDAEPLIELLEGRIPGEEVLVRRMLLGIVERLDYGRHIKPEKILFFDSGSGSDDAGLTPLLDPERLAPRLRGLGKDCRTVSLGFERTPEGDPEALETMFDPPTATVDDSLTLTTDSAYLTALRRRNRRGTGGGWDGLGVLLNDCYQRRGKTTLEILRGVLALKRVLEVNPAMPLTLEGFHVGRNIVFPDAESLEASSHVVDRRAAELFYGSLDYYFAFEQKFQKAYQGLKVLLERESAGSLLNPTNPPVPFVPLRGNQDSCS